MFKTIQELEDYLKSHVSEKRYVHSLGVAKTTEMVLKHYGKEIEKFGCFESAYFCGIAHDLGREFSDEEIVDFCRENDISLSKEELDSPVLAHGYVSASLAEKLCGNYPQSWKKAICVHTTGDSDMDDLALALFVSDYIEPSRVFMTEVRRQGYLNEPTLKKCAYRVLCDMVAHWKEKGYHDASNSSLKMLAELGG